MKRTPLAVSMREFVRVLPIQVFMVVNVYSASRRRSDLNARRCCGMSHSKHQSSELL